MQGDVMSMYCKCSACNKPVIVTLGCMQDHYAGCKKRLRSIGQLDAGASNNMHDGMHIHGHRRHA